MTRDGWKRMRLGDFVTLQRGHDLPEGERRAGAVPVIGSFGITGWHDAPKASGPGVTVGRSGASFGVVSFTAVDYWPLNTALYVTDFHGNDARFAYYLLKLFNFKSYNSGTAQPSLNRNFIHPVEIDVPPVEEQRAIASTLGDIDDKIHANASMNATIDELVLAAFDQRFGGGSHELVMPLSDLMELRRNVVDPRATPDEEFDHYSVPAYDAGRLPQRQRGAEIRSSKFAVATEGVLVSKLNPEFLRVWLPLPADGRRQITSTEFMVFTPRLPATTEYLYALWRSAPLRLELTARVTGTSGSHQRVRPEDVLKAQVSRPDQKEVADFTAFVVPMLKRVELNLAQSKALVSLRDTLMPELLSGRVRAAGSLARAS